MPDSTAAYGSEVALEPPMKPAEVTTQLPVIWTMIQSECPACQAGGL